MHSVSCQINFLIYYIKNQWNYNAFQTHLNRSEVQPSHNSWGGPVRGESWWWGWSGGGVRSSSPFTLNNVPVDRLMKEMKLRGNHSRVRSLLDENNFLIYAETTKAKQPYLMFSNLCPKSFSLSAAWTSEEEGWWPASILMFNPISVSTLDKPLLPVIHHLHNNGTPRTLIKNINLPCPLSRNVHYAHCSGGDAISIHINGCLLSRQ